MGVTHGESQTLVVSPRSARVAKAMEEQLECCGIKLSGNSLTLITAAFLFSLITAVQYIFAKIANSLALEADCLSMGIDALTYLASLAVECMPEETQESDTKRCFSKKSVELGMAGVSYIILIGFTVSFMAEAVDTLTETGDDHEEEVNGYIVLGFAIGGLIFDGASLYVFQQYGEREHEDELDLGSDEDGDAEGSETICGINHNMTAALLHVVSDLLRSTTTLVESIIILTVPSIPSDHADGVSALIVCSIIAIGSLGALYKWVKAVYAHVTGNEETMPVVAVKGMDLEMASRVEEKSEDQETEASLVASTRPSAVQQV